MAKPTPGPWAVHAHATDTYTIYVAGRHWDSWAVAHVGYTKEDESNARLIAAAPDLLAALQACDEAMEYMSEYDIPITLPEQVKAAIKKATGEE